MPTPSLLVPINIEALVANDAVIARDSFRWWPFNYISLNHFKSPEPAALARGVTRGARPRQDVAHADGVGDRKRLSVHLEGDRR